MKELIDKLESMGLMHYGFMKVRVLEESRAYFEMRRMLGHATSFEETDVERKADLRVSMPKAKTILSIAFPYFHDGSMSKGGYFSLYTLGKDYHVVVRGLLEEIATLLREKGYEAECFVDNNALPERLIAYLSGVGDIGRNHMLITKTYGSYVFLGEILTDLEVESQERPLEELFAYAVCADCTRCLKACPTRILGERHYDTHRCMSYITQSKEIADTDFPLFKGRLFGCDTCQRVCPLNQGKAKSPIDAFEPLRFMQHPDVEAILSMSNAQFKAYQETSSGWRGKKLLQRNALIELVRRGASVEETALKTPYLKDYHDRLVRYFKKEEERE